MEQPFPTRDPIEGLHFTFKSDEAQANAEGAQRVSSSPRAETDDPGADEPDDRLHFPHMELGRTPLTDPALWAARRVVRDCC